MANFVLETINVTGAPTELDQKEKRGTALIVRGGSAVFGSSSGDYGSGVCGLSSGNYGAAVVGIALTPLTQSG